MTQHCATLALLFATASVAGIHAQTLPATAPTQLPAAGAQQAPIAATPAVTRGHKAYVTFENGLLNVRADNSSLNVILREVARVTGMEITGGVTDQRVFGNYGPADPGTVLATLLDGTGVNILVKGDAWNRPTDLILTPRTGGATPPSPHATQFDEEARSEDDADRDRQPQPEEGDRRGTSGPPGPPQPGMLRGDGNGRPAQPTNTTQLPPASTSNGTTPVPDPAQAPVPPVTSASPVTTPPSAPQPLNNVNGSSANTSPTASTLPVTDSVSTDSIPTPPTTPSSTGIVDAPNPAPAGTTANPAGSSVTGTTTAADGTTTTTTVTSPNGAKTPDDIYKQLLQMQQAQQKAAGGSSGTTTTTPQ